MFVTWGQRFYGKVDSLGGAYVTTRFHHFQLLPFVPQTSWLIVVGGPRERAMVLPLVGRSVLGGYLRVWAPAATFVAMALSDRVSLGFVPIALLAAVTAIWAWARVGRLSSVERAQRQVYAHFAGAAVDVALIAQASRGPDAKEASEWIAEVTQKAKEAICTEGTDLAGSYRGLARHTDWRQVAERPETATALCQHAALTLARIAWATPSASQPDEAARAHLRIWTAIASGPRAPELPR